VSKVHRVDRDGIALLTLDNPPVNALNFALRAGLLAAVGEAAADDSVQAIVLTGSARAFSAGGDIREFGTPSSTSAPMVRDLSAAFDEVRKPLIAAIAGLALGGGLELALACHYRVAAPGARLGLPEVSLGIVPSGGGTQRLPRIIPAEVATRMLTSGEPVIGEEALKIGLVDDILTGELPAGALDYAARLVALNRGVRRTRDMPARWDPAEAFLATERGRLSEAGQRNPALPRVLDCVEASLKLPFDEGQKVAEVAWAELMHSPHAQAFRAAFLAGRGRKSTDGREKN